MKTFVAFRRDRDGATLVEFAAIAGPLLFILMGTFELGYQAYATSVVQGTVEMTARRLTLEGATTTDGLTFAKEKVKAFSDPANVTLTVTSYESFDGVGKPEKITTDTAPLGAYNVGDCYIDANNNGAYNTSQGTSGIGGAEDIVKVTLRTKIRKITPLSNGYYVTRTAIGRNEPYAASVDPVTRCN